MLTIAGDVAVSGKPLGNQVVVAFTALWLAATSQIAVFPVIASGLARSSYAECPWVFVSSSALRPRFKKVVVKVEVTSFTPLCRV
jgi:hypothetical protein